MLDAMVAMTDIVTNFWSLGLRGGQLAPLIMHGFRARDGWFIVQVGREPQFAALAELIGQRGWVTDPRFADRQGWVDHMDDVIRPAIEAWATAMTRLEACGALSAVGIAAGPCFTDEEVVSDPHVAARNMLVEMPRTDGVEQPVLVPGNPVKLTDVAEGPETRVPWLGEHTDAVLGEELELAEEDLKALRQDGVIG
jgi:formyl-CoA transferase